MVNEQRYKQVIGLVGILVVSGLSGMVGGLYGQSAYQEQLTRLTLPTLRDTSTTRTSGEQTPAELLQEVGGSILTVFTAENEVPKKGKMVEQKLVMSGYALAITTDGWVVAPTSTIGDIKTTQIIDRDRKQYRIAKRVDDTAVPLSYLRLESEQSILLKPIVFPAVQARTLPLSGYFIRDYRTIEPLVFAGLGYPVAAEATKQQSSVLGKRFNYYQQHSVTGQPFISTKQEVLGVSVAEGFVPLDSIRSGLEQVLRSGVIKRPNLGVTYADNSWVVMPISGTGGVARVGATVTSVIPSAKPKEIAPIALKVGDVITTVNDERIDDRRSLSEILQEYKVGDTVTLGLQRGAKTETLKVLLQ